MAGSDGRRPERRAGVGGETVGARSSGSNEKTACTENAAARTAREPRAADKATGRPPATGGQRPKGDIFRRLTGWGNRDAFGGTVDTVGMRPMHSKHAVKRRMHPEFTRKASGS